MPGDVRRFSEAEANRLVRFYEQAEREILDRLNRALLRGNKTEYLAQMKKNVEAILQQLREGNRAWCEQAIPQMYSQGLYSADAMLKDTGAHMRAGFGTIHQQAAHVLAENTFQRLQDVTQVIGRQAEGIHRDLALENIRGTVAGHDTWKQTARRYREQLSERGVTGFRDRSGKMWNMRSYAEMVARTSTMEAHLQGTANRLTEYDYDLVKVSSHAGACELCVPWQGAIISLTGKTPGYPTLAEARGTGLFHPNCRHAYGLHIDFDKEIEELEEELKSVEDNLPNFEKAIVPPEKLANYALNKEHSRGGKDKAIAFERALGYNINNYHDLKDNITENLSAWPAALKGRNQYGDKYEVMMILSGPNGKTAKVATAWLVDKTGETRLVSTYVKS